MFSDVLLELILSCEPFQGSPILWPLRIPWPWPVVDFGDIARTGHIRLVYHSQPENSSGRDVCLEHADGSPSCGHFACFSSSHVCVPAEYCKQIANLIFPSAIHILLLIKEDSVLPHYPRM